MDGRLVSEVVIIFSVTSLKDGGLTVHLGIEWWPSAFTSTVRESIGCGVCGQL